MKSLTDNNYIELEENVESDFSNIGNPLKVKILKDINPKLLKIRIKHLEDWKNESPQLNKPKPKAKRIFNRNPNPCRDKEKLKIRNARIIGKHKAGATLTELSQEYKLDLNHIRSIINREKYVGMAQTR